MDNPEAANNKHSNKEIGGFRAEQREPSKSTDKQTTSATRYQDPAMQSDRQQQGFGISSRRRHRRHGGIAVLQELIVDDHLGPDPIVDQLQCLRRAYPGVQHREAARL